MNHSVKGTIDGVEGTAPPATPNIPAHERLMLLEQSLDHLPIGVTVYDAEFRLLTWNSTAEEILDTPPGLLRNDMPGLRRRLRALTASSGATAHDVRARS